MSYKAVILCGGISSGTRFRPLSLKCPKPLFPIANKPVIYHHINSCVRQLGNDLKEVILLGFFQENVFNEFIEETSSELGVKIRYLKEEGELGTAGGLYKFKNEILSGLEDDEENNNIIVLHCDVLCRFPLIEMIETHNNHHKLCTLLTRSVPADSTQNYGVVVVDEETNEVSHYVEKPLSFVNDFVNCGVYIFSLNIFSVIETRAKEKKNSQEIDIYDDFDISNNSDLKVALERDILLHEAGTQSIYAHLLPSNGLSKFWFQLKHPGTALECTDLLLSIYNKENQDKLSKSSEESPMIVGNVLIDPSAKLDASAKIGPNVTIGKNVIVGQGVRLKNCIILDNVEIKKRSFVSYSIIGWNTIIHAWARVEGDLINKDNVNVGSSKSGGLTILGNDVLVYPQIIIRSCIVLPHKEVKKSTFNDIML
eukprot:TRINITY_DN7436_c0_g1_i1.p1 TRINITY_DN7436_c0_g1~~TRINITY_DN7436_c0_g1_i1.p1  ORF type:complete len:425 (-),score=140.50 TRINITY_DN7436_c0_g1_i1:878-2152(-)